jgi:tetratricopeptide (TPR) repeat protein
MKINLNNKIFLILITLIVNSYDANAKNTKQFDMSFEAAQIQFKLGNYYKALPMYLELYKLDSSNYNISYLVGVCYKNGRTQRKRALYYLEKAATHTTKNYKQNSSTERDAPTFVFMLLGDEYQRNSKFDKAINAYNNYKSEMAENNEKIK